MDRDLRARRRIFSRAAALIFPLLNHFENGCRSDTFQAGSTLELTRLVSVWSDDPLVATGAVVTAPVIRCGGLRRRVGFGAAIGGGGFWRLSGCRAAGGGLHAGRFGCTSGGRVGRCQESGSREQRKANGSGNDFSSHSFSSPPFNEAGLLSPPGGGGAMQLPSLMQTEESRQGRRLLSAQRRRFLEAIRPGRGKLALLDRPKSRKSIFQMIVPNYLEAGVRETRQRGLAAKFLRERDLAEPIGCRPSQLG